MKISKRSNGSYVLRVNQVEATISGTQSIKEVYELYEKLFGLVGSGQELKKIEPETELKKIEPEKKAPETASEMSRPELIFALLKKHGPLTVKQMREIAKLENDVTNAWHGAISFCNRSKKLKRKKDKATGQFVYSLPE